MCPITAAIQGLQTSGPFGAAQGASGSGLGGGAFAQGSGGGDPSGGAVKQMSSMSAPTPPPPAAPAPPGSAPIPPVGDMPRYDTTSPDYGNYWKTGPKMFGTPMFSERGEKQAAEGSDRALAMLRSLQMSGQVPEFGPVPTGGFRRGSLDEYDAINRYGG